MKTRITLSVNCGEYGISFFIETPEPLELKIMSKRKLIVTSNPNVTIETQDDIIEVKISEV